MGIMQAMFKQFRKPTGWMAKFAGLGMNREHKKVWRWGLEHIAIPPDAVILDVGCGSGRYCVEFAARDAAEVVGVDLSEQMLVLGRHLAAERGLQEKCSFVRTDILDYHPPQPFDGIIAMGLFDYIRDLVPVMDHLKKLLRGQLVASFPVSWAFRAPFRKIWLTLRGCPVYFFFRRAFFLVDPRALFAGFFVPGSSPNRIVGSNSPKRGTPYC